MPKCLVRASPPNYTIKKCIQLDQVLTSETLHADWFVEIIDKTRNNTIIYILIEDTGTPELRDVKKLIATESMLKEKGFVKGEAAIIKIIHHKGGVSQPLKKDSSKQRIKLLKCNRTLAADYIIKTVLG